MDEPQGCHDREVEGKFLRSFYDVTRQPAEPPTLGHQLATGLSAQGDFSIEWYLSPRTLVAAISLIT